MSCPACDQPDHCTPTIFIVDDDEAMRHSLEFLLESFSLPVETHDSAEAFLARWRPGRPGCLVLDLRMPGMSGLDLQRVLNQQDATLGVIFITAHGDIPMAVDAMRQGAIDVLEKPFGDQVLLGHVATALERSRLVCRTQARRHDVNQRLDSLSLREREVMERVVRGKPNKVIAYELGLSIKTVEVHRHNLMEKMGAGSVADLTRMQVDAEI